MKKILIIFILASALVISCRAAEGDVMITYLSDMEWTGAQIYDGANGGVPTRDENVAGEELWLYDMYFEKGVGMHAAPGKLAYIEVDIEGKGFKTFYTYVGTAESELYDVTMASVRFVFKADGKTVARTGVVTPKKRPELITFDVTGVKTLRIEMDDGGDGISGDWGSLGSALFSTSDNVDEIAAALQPATEAVTEHQTTETVVTERITEERTEKQTEKAAGTEAVTEEIKPEEKSAFPVIPVIAVTAAVIAVAAAVIAVMRRRKIK